MVHNRRIRRVSLAPRRSALLPKEEVRPSPGETYSVRPRRPHLVTNAGETATFLVLQGIGEYDFVPLLCVAEFRFGLMLGKAAA